MIIAIQNMNTIRALNVCRRCLTTILRTEDEPSKDLIRDGEVTNADGFHLLIATKNFCLSGLAMQFANSGTKALSEEDRVSDSFVLGDLISVIKATLRNIDKFVPRHITVVFKTTQRRYICRTTRVP